MADRIYLACPYTHADPAIREERFLAVTYRAAQLMSEGLIVYSPITMGHSINAAMELPHDWAYWANHCLSYLEHWASRLDVLPLPGWEKSVGVTAEIATARRLGLPVTLLEV